MIFWTKKSFLFSFFDQIIRKMYSKLDRRMEESYNNGPDTPYTLIVKIWPLLRSHNDSIWQKYTK